MKKLLNESKDAARFNTVFCLLKESIDSSKPLEFEVISNSMFPFLRILDKVTIGNLTSKELKLGDIVVYQTDTCLCAHRYIYTLKRKGRPLGLVTKADSLSDFDSSLVPFERLLGKVIMVKRLTTVINLESFLFRKINYLIGFLSFLQASMIKVLRYLKNLTFLGDKPLPLLTLFKRTVASPFSFLIKSITALACQH